MGVPRWCSLGITILLLVSQIIISQLCRSFVMMVDSFHTLFILMHMALPRPQPKPCHPSYDPQPLTASSTSTSHGLHPCGSPPGPVLCRMSHTDNRTRPVGVFVSALLLASLCIACLMDVISFPLDTHPVERPSLLVAVGVVSLLHNVTVLWITWKQQQGGPKPKPKPDCYIEVNHEALAQEDSLDKARPRDVSRVQPGMDRSVVSNGELVVCDPATPSVPDERAAAANCKLENLSADVTKDSGCLDNPCAVGTPLHVPSSRRPLCASLWVCLVQGLSSTALVLITSLVLQLAGPVDLLVYLDPGLASLAAVIMVATVAPQMRRYGLMLMQAAPPHVCVSDVRMKIRSVPGVETVHDLHIWELADSVVVASVHVRCHAAFATHRCADLMSGVTKVLQSVGVTCCTVQPEFEPCTPPVLACSLSCGKVCAGHACCPLPQGQDCTSLAAPATEDQTTAEPQLHNTCAMKEKVTM
uniref:proton-coupled zinc antiporter SLC30A1 n=1 Tax=Doryrhamphus excisus TaxID=161450 RepID=UPI0025AE472E|nr:proton-coupled zinc antiporter SLC30A1 [Doryrhamphus excisus]